MDNIFIIIIVFTLIGSVVSLAGGILLFFHKKAALRSSHYLSAYAAGTLLGAAFFDLLPEGLEELHHLAEEGTIVESNIFFWTLIGILTFFLLERFIHHHDQEVRSGEKKTIIPLIIIGDTLHNFIDGVAIAATFLINIPLGIVTTIAVSMHEIPQEIGDFGLLLSKGVSRRMIVKINLFSALAAVTGAVLTYLLQDQIKAFLPAVLAITAGFFVYIALTNLIPEIHSRDNKRVAFGETVMLLIGAGTIYLVISLLEGAH